MRDILQNHAIITCIGIVAGILTSASTLPQLIKTIKMKEAGDISSVMLIVLICGAALWVFYGFLRSDIPIILTDSFAVLLNVFMLYLHHKYKNR